MNRVSIVKCDDYEAINIKNAVRQSIDYLGGMPAFVKPGDRVLLKANLLMKRRPERATTTHPAVVQAVAELVVEAGGKPVIGDSPGGNSIYNRKLLEPIYETCGMRDAAEKSGAELNYDTDMIDVPFPEGNIIKTIKTFKTVVEVDKIINLPKLKTHVMMVYSGAVKNLFGIVPGRFKTEYHLRFEDIAVFTGILIDICRFAKPVLTVMDAVVGMDGHGPSTGSPKKIGLIIAGSDPFALDAAAVRIVGFEPEQVPTVKKSIEMGLIGKKIEDIGLSGKSIESVTVKGFKKPPLKTATNFYNRILPGFIAKIVSRLLKPGPCFNHDKCAGCGMCVKSCPPKAIDMKNGRPWVNLDKCIRCFCCHELCSYEAVFIKRPFLTRLILR